MLDPGKAGCSQRRGPQTGGQAKSAAPGSRGRGSNAPQSGWNGRAPQGHHTGDSEASCTRLPPGDTHYIAAPTAVNEKIPHCAREVGVHHPPAGTIPVVTVRSGRRGSCRLLCTALNGQCQEVPTKNCRIHTGIINGNGQVQRAAFCEPHECGYVQRRQRSRGSLRWGQEIDAGYAQIFDDISHSRKSALFHLQAFAAKYQFFNCHIGAALRVQRRGGVLHGQGVGQVPGDNRVYAGFIH